MSISTCIKFLCILTYYTKQKDRGGFAKFAPASTVGVCWGPCFQRACWKCSSQVLEPGKTRDLTEQLVCSKLLNSWNEAHFFCVLIKRKFRILLCKVHLDELSRVSFCALSCWPNSPRPSAFSLPHLSNPDVSDALKYSVFWKEPQRAPLPHCSSPPLPCPCLQGRIVSGSFRSSRLTRCAWGGYH